MGFKLSQVHNRQCICRVCSIVSDFQYEDQQEAHTQEEDKRGAAVFTARANGTDETQRERVTSF